MIYQNINFHNVEELIQTPKGYAMARIPKDIRLQVNEGIRNRTCFYSTGVELRFKLLGEKATIFLRTDKAQEAQAAYIYYGSIQGGWENSSKTIFTEVTPITISRPDNIAKLAEITMQNNLPFQPEVIRIVLPYGTCYFVGVEGDIEPPSPEDMPEKTYLAYGSSITHGSLALAAPYTYPFRIAAKLKCDYLNLGFAGTAHLEKSMAEYLISRKDWDFASVEMGINMIGEAFTIEFFEKQVKEFVEVLAEDTRPIFATNIFGFNGIGQDKAEKYREIVQEHAQDRLIFTDGLELMNNPAYISQDLTHPSLDGIEEIVKNWSGVMKLEL